MIFRHREMMLAVVLFVLLFGVPTDGQADVIRLVSRTGLTTNITVGRLELFINGEWGTVCLDNFGATLDVACCQLGFSGGAVAAHDQRNLGYPLATGPIWLDGVSCPPVSADVCSPEAADLLDCSHMGVGQHECDHGQDMILSCREEGSVRLQGDPNRESFLFPFGRLEIFRNGRWGTVCDSGFTDTSADVVCQQLGFTGAVRWTNIGAQSVFPSAPAGIDIFLDNIQCRSSDHTLLSCPRSGVVATICGHSQDVVIFCELGADPVRLVSQTGLTGNRTAGRLEVFIDNRWGTVCVDHISPYSGSVICTQLGLSGSVSAQALAIDLGYSTTTPQIFLDNLSCHHENTHIRACWHLGVGVTNCDHREDLIVSCQVEGSVRLVDSNISTLSPFGRLEVFLNGRWGTVCDNGFSNTSANVACQQLGFSVAEGWTNIGAQNLFSPAPFGTDILLDNVQCSSTDQTLLSCPRNMGTVSCDHSEDVVVFCEINDDPVRLVSQTGETTNMTAGRLEIFINNQWGTICNKNFDDDDAGVACRQLGLSSVASTHGTTGNLGAIEKKKILLKTQRVIVSWCCWWLWSCQGEGGRAIDYMLLHP